MKNFKRVLALVVALMLTLALVSCGGDKSDKSDSKPESSADQSNVSNDSSNASNESNESADASDVASEDASADASEESTDASSEESSEESSEDVVDDNRPVANAVYGTPKVNVSTIDPLWANVPEYKGEKIRLTAGTNNPDKAIEDTFTRFTFKLMWDETHLYVLEHETDISIGSFNEEWTWRNDATEIAMSLNCSNDTVYDFAFDGWLGISPYEFTYGSEDETQLFGAGLEYIEFAADFDDTGYYVCAAFDISAMNSDVEWGEGTQIGFEISVNDRVVDDERACCIAWADDTDTSYQNPSVMGKVTLVK